MDSVRKLCSPAYVYLVISVVAMIAMILQNAICKAGYKRVSWFLVLMPFILFFVLIGLMMVMMAGEGVKIALE